MKIRMIAFGSLTEILGNESIVDVADTESLLADLKKKYPSLAGRKMLIAVNERVIKENTLLNEHDTVALMPPYSGG